MRLYNYHDVAEILAEACGDECACNLNDNDEWLPKYCEYADTCCPYPEHLGCWEQYVLHLDKLHARKKQENHKP